MKTAIKKIIFISFLILSCTRTGYETQNNQDCFIINGCEETNYDLSQIFIRISANVEKKYQIFQTVLHKNTDPYDINIDLPSLYKICGTVKFDDSPIYSNIKFVQENTDMLTPATLTDTDENGRFCTILVEGKYTILISPYKKDTIPQLKTEIKVERNIDDLVISYPSGEEVRYIYGNLILDTKSGIPVEGINVLAYKEYSDGITIQSNISVTDKDGRFYLIIPSKYENFSLMIYGSTENPDWPVIRFNDIITEGVIQVGTIGLDFVPPVRHIYGSILSGEKNRIIASMDEENFTYTKVFSTDSDGYFETDLREGKYTFHIIPEDTYNSIWGIKSLSNISIPLSENFTTAMDKKVILSGRISIPNEEFTPKIDIIRTGGCNSTQTDNINLEYSILLEQSGQFRSPISKGKYIIKVTTQNVQKSILISDSFCVDEDIDLGDLILPGTCILNLRLNKAEGINLSDLKAEVFIFDKSHTNFVKIADSTEDTDTITLRIPQYLCK